MKPLKMSATITEEKGAYLFRLICKGEANIHILNRKITSNEINTAINRKSAIKRIFEVFAEIFNGVLEKEEEK